MYEEMTVAQLREACKDRGISGFSKLKKAELVDLLTSHDREVGDEIRMNAEIDGQIEVSDRMPEVLGERLNKLAVMRAEDARAKRNRAKARRRKLRAQGWPAGFMA